MKYIILSQDNDIKRTDHLEAESFADAEKQILEIYPKTIVSSIEREDLPSSIIFYLLSINEKPTIDHKPLEICDGRTVYIRTQLSSLDCGKAFDEVNCLSNETVLNIMPDDLKDLGKEE